MDMHGDLPFSKAFDFASGSITARFTNPFWKPIEYLSGAKLRKAVKDIKEFGTKIVANSVCKREEAASQDQEVSPSRASFMQENLINALLDNISDHGVVADAAMNFLSAGRDTTAQSLTWTFYSLMRHPECISPLLSELSTLQHNPKSTALPLSYATIQSTSLSFTAALFSETLRLYPPVPFELKENVSATTFPDGTYLPAKSVVLWVPWSLGRSTRIWGPDATQFKPERWLIESKDDPGKKELMSKTAYEFPVFNAGPRTCLGKKMAESLGVYVIAALVWEYEFEEVRDEKKGGVGLGKERVSQDSLTLPMEGGLPCFVRRREKS